MLLGKSVMRLRKVTNLWCASEVKFLSNDYTNPNTNTKTLTTLSLALTNPHDDFESLCAPVLCNFVRNYSGAYVGPLPLRIEYARVCVMLYLYVGNADGIGL